MDDFLKSLGKGMDEWLQDIEHRDSLSTLFLAYVEEGII